MITCAQLLADKRYMCKTIWGQNILQGTNYGNINMPEKTYEQIRWILIDADVVQT
jgi:hypothetical protein